MARPSPYRPFTPKPEQLALRPGISGNTINGVGETSFRPRSYVYWAPNPDEIAHGKMQRWFYTVSPNEPEMLKARVEREKILDEPMAVLAVQHGFEAISL